MIARAREFKRSWVEMAEALVRVRASRAYERWGWQDVYSYCQEELHIKKATVDKLTLSFTALRRHAPDVLERDGVEERLPSIDAVDYFARAMRTSRAEADAEADADAEHDDAPDHSPAVIADLRRAVFDDHENVIALRRRFDPVLHPKPDGAEDLAALERTRAAARRLQQLLETCPGLSKRRAAEVRGVLESLRDELGPLVEDARERTKSVA
jgi:hypothetical protein